LTYQLDSNVISKFRSSGICLPPKKEREHEYFLYPGTRNLREALGASDYATIVSLFASGGRVRSLFLGEMEVKPFFEQLGNASAKNVITPIAIFVSSTDRTDRNEAVAYFQYDWSVTEGTLITFKVMDLFRIKPSTDKVEYLDLIYDRHPIRAAVGNKYEV
jgi:hypothetical protein